MKVERLCIDTGNANDLNGVICYPPNWNENDCNSNCIIFNNPNGIVIAQFFQGKNLTYTPKQLMNLYNCPIFLYDYRGTGLNSNFSEDISSLKSMGFSPTYSSVVEDGSLILNILL